MFPAPYSSNPSQNLDNLLLTFGPVWRRANDLLAGPSTGSSDLQQLKDEMIALDQAFATWQEAQVKHLKGCTVGHVSQRPAGSKLNAGYWPGKVDTYFDLYVAGMWNTSRTARLLLIDLIFKLSNLLPDNAPDKHSRQRQDSARLIDDLVSSIPFHLAEDLQVFVRDLARDDAAASISPGRPVGGLLLMHLIYIASKLPIVPQPLDDYLRDCLEWIAMNMGIGQASLFAKVCVFGTLAGLLLNPLC